MPAVEIAKIAYNPAAGAYQARVDVITGGRCYRYPCEVAGPLDMDMGDVRQRLVRQAVNMSDTGVSLLSKI
jgi:hypothetical protein